MKANPFISRNEYLFKLSYPYILMMGMDNTHSIILSEAGMKKYKENEEWLMWERRLSDKSRLTTWDDILKKAEIPQMKEEGNKEE